MYRVLIVDDEVPFLQSLSMFDWKSYGCQCVGQATNGQEALEKCAALAPHIVISDINMPLLDGLSFLSEIKQHYPEIQVILLTVHRDFEYAQKAVKLGACDYLVKDMDYRSQLPIVLSKAIKPFEQQPSKMNFSANLLRRSGRMLVIESNDVLHAYQEKVEYFLKKYAGTLITAKIQSSCYSQNSLISNLDLFLSSVEENIGLIVRDTSCFEILVGKSVRVAEGWVLGILTHECLKPVWKDTCFALTSCGSTLIEYKEAHDLNIQMLERGFYSAQPKVIISKQTNFTTLPSAIVDEWIRSTEALIHVDGSASEVLNQIVEEAKKYFFYPPMVRRAFDSILSTFELRYAASSEKDAHAYILNAPNAQLMAQKLLTTVKKMRTRQNNYSYFIVQAKEYMLSNLGKPSLQLLDIAEYVGVSPGYLSKKLKEETGYSFQELLIKMRMEFASGLLKKSNKRVYEISEMVGYENYRSFSLAFSRYYGVSPQKYKKI